MKRLTVLNFDGRNTEMIFALIPIYITFYVKFYEDNMKIRIFCVELFYLMGIYHVSCSSEQNIRRG